MVIQNFEYIFAYLKWHGQGLFNNVYFAKKKNFFANCQFFLQILKEEHKSFPILYHLSYLDIKALDLEGRQIDPPSSVSWFSSTPAGIGLMYLIYFH